MEKGKIFLITFILIILAVLFFFLIQEKNQTKFFSQQSQSQSAQTSDVSKITNVKIGDTIVAVDLAVTPATREQGLSGRASLAENAGMLFVFQTPGVYPFWMPNMNFPLDIIWFDQNMRVIYIKADAEPSSYPATFGPNQNATYVLEVVSGFAQKHNVKVGDTAQFLP